MPLESGTDICLAGRAPDEADAPTSARRGNRGVPRTVEPSGAPWRVLETSEPDSEIQAAQRSRAVPWLPISGAALAAMVAIAALALALRGDPGVIVQVPPASGLPARSMAESSRLQSPSEIVVDVGGAVARPGVYHLRDGARVADAISAAGGYGARVDAERADRELNLAAVIHDGDQIHVPARGETNPGIAGVGEGTDGGSTGGLVDLNHASAEELDTLPGVGPVTAAKIIAAREEQSFTSVDDLATRKVVGPATLTKLRALVTVGP